MVKVKVAATQMSCSWDIENNIQKATGLIKNAAEKGAHIILLQELFKTPYFCIEEDYEFNKLAEPFDNNELISYFKKLAKELQVVLPISYFERAGNTRFNSVAIIDADGEVKGHYRKSHIPHGSGYQEKFYFSPGDTGFQVTQTAYAKIGVGICWDQWFPEAARAMALKGAELLFYPTAIGSELSIEGHDSSGHWRRVMQGHAGANLVPLIASNRVGKEIAKNSDNHLSFYGNSFIADQFGEIVNDADREEETVLVAEFDLNICREMRDSWGVFRDRRPDLYGDILKMDASV
ncbi:N-carbamoylputrescine amidase [Curvivirga aplysinae]|uniref:N-carbamoylputrescine amidase n=1 Tax=Curvivirga aplysinae TaxID=2529852 RepID=UPI0012BC0B4D|nr:N-carbamoylputrescine amidase [Curvivirga aplysinae]MTI10870.1 N-carbamoylputrescine amidase [Curvivirga aplysinae]